LWKNPRDEVEGIIPQIIFAEPEDNNGFSIIAQVIIRVNAFSFFFSPETSKIAQWPF